MNKYRKEAMRLVSKAKAHTECNRCGECCQRFPLPWTRAMLDENKKAALKGDCKFEYRDIDGDMKTRRVHPQMAVWCDNLHEIPQPSMSDESLTWNDIEDPGDIRHFTWYACGFYEEKNGLGACSIHEDRPSVCKGYKPRSMGGYLQGEHQIPYKKCSYRGHDWEDSLQALALPAPGAFRDE